jgi:hypothetical protein
MTELSLCTLQDPTFPRLRSVDWIWQVRGDHL